MGWHLSCSRTARAPPHGDPGVNKVTDEVQNAGPLFGEGTPYSFSTGEGWYFSAMLPTKLYTHLVGGTQLRRYDVLTRQFDVLPALDLKFLPSPARLSRDGKAESRPSTM